MRPKLNMVCSQKLTGVYSYHCNRVANKMDQEKTKELKIILSKKANTLRIIFPKKISKIILKRKAKVLQINPQKEVKVLKIILKKKETCSNRESINRTEIERINKAKFAKNNKALNAKDEAEKLPKIIIRGKELGSGSFGDVYELHNDKNYVLKVLNEKELGFSEANGKALEEFEKAEKLRGIIENYIKNYNFAGAQGLENVVAPVLLKEGVLYNRNVRKKKMVLKNKLILPKAEGEDGDKSIFGNPKDGGQPILIYRNKVGSEHFAIKSRRMALSIALQKAMMLRALNNGGYANIDTKLENIMISKDGKVSMIDIGSIVKHGSKDYLFTEQTVAPELWKSNGSVNSQADVFSDAIDRPYVLFGNIAERYIPTFPKMNKKDISLLKGVVTSKYIRKYTSRFGRKKKTFEEIGVPLSWKFMSYEKIAEEDLERNVKNKIKEYENEHFDKPTFPEYFTNAQKMRYMYYHLGFLRIQDEIKKENVNITKEIEENKKIPDKDKQIKIEKKFIKIYPPEVLDSLAKLQALSTEPNPGRRIDEEIVEKVLLHLMMSANQWEKGIYRIKGIKITPGSMSDEILPKNRSSSKENFIQNQNLSSCVQKFRLNIGKHMQNRIQKIRLKIRVVI